jgi:hypothetical protein
MKKILDYLNDGYENVTYAGSNQEGDVLYFEGFLTGDSMNITVAEIERDNGTKLWSVKQYNHRTGHTNDVGIID